MRDMQLMPDDNDTVTLEEWVNAACGAVVDAMHSGPENHRAAVAGQFADVEKQLPEELSELAAFLGTLRALLAGEPRAVAGDKSLREFQQEVDDWIQSWGGGYWSPMSNLARIIEEVGEVARLLNDRFGEKPKKAGEPEQDLGMELTDIMYAIICLANSQGIDLQESFERMMDKYRTRDKHRYVRDR